MRNSAITSLLLDESDRQEFVDLANKVFEKVLVRVEARNPDAAWKAWDAGKYVDRFIGVGMLPITRGYAQSMMEAFIPSYACRIINRTENGLDTSDLE